MGNNGDSSVRQFGVLFLAFITLLASTGITRSGLAQDQNQVTKKTVIQTGRPAAANGYHVPLFRHVDPTAPEPDTKDRKILRFLVDGNFPPFSYRNRDGALSGFNVALADALCRSARLKCEFIVKPWHELLAGLYNNDGDVVLSGIRLSAEADQKYDFTRPYFRMLGHFAIRNDSPISDTDLTQLAGRTIGVVNGTAHKIWLKQHYKRISLRGFDNFSAMVSALNSGHIDAVFGDAVQLSFWLSGSDSQKCCRMVGRGFSDVTGFSQPMTMVVRNGDRVTLDILDYGLDRLQSSGLYARIFQRFFPISPW